MHRAIILCLIAVIAFSCDEKEVGCDADGDGCIDQYDDFPRDVNYYRDSDLDGIADELDVDIDGDGYADNVAALAQHYPDSSQSFWESLAIDTVVSQQPSCLEDADGDGCNDLFDHYPDDPGQDTDSSLYNNESDIPDCEQRMTDCERRHDLHLDEP